MWPLLSDAQLNGAFAGTVVRAITAERHCVSVVDRLGAERGAYLLLISLPRPVRLSFQSIKPRVLLSGEYIYAGSAWGPGGIRARVKRHMKRGKRRHWHVDDLTEAANAILPFAVPGGYECDLVRSLLAQDQFSVSVRGFGSSDCNRCDSHLLVAAGSEVQVQEIEPIP